MDTTLPLLLLIEASLLTLGASYSITVDHRCPFLTAIANEMATVTTVREGYESKEETLYVHPDPGFRGVSLVASGESWTHTESIMLAHTCFPQDAEWWKLTAGVLRNLDESDLKFYGLIGKCQFNCFMKGKVPGDLSLNIMAHGSSKFRFQDPDNCTTINYLHRDYLKINCTNPPAPMTSPTTNKTSTTAINTHTPPLSPDLNLRCPANTIISPANESSVNITTVQTLENVHEKTLYVYPDPGFKGIRLLATGDGWNKDAWFRLDNTCFPQKAVWWQMWVNVNRKLDNNQHTLWFKVSVGKCAYQCSRIGSFLGDINVNLEAQGPSLWTLKDPTPCKVEKKKQLEFSAKECATTLILKTITITSTTSTTSTPTTSKSTKVITDVVVSVVVIVIIVLVVGVVVAKRRNRQGRCRVQSWSRLSVCWGVGSQAVDDNSVLPPVQPRSVQAAPWPIRGEAAANNNRVESPTVAAVPLSVPPKRGLSASSSVRGKAAAYYDTAPPRVVAVPPSMPPRRGLAASSSIRGEAAAYYDRAPPKVVMVPPSVPQRRGLAASSSVRGEAAAYNDTAPPWVARVVPPQEESDYLYMGGEEPIKEERTAPTACRQYMNVDDDDDYLIPRYAFSGTPSWVMEDEEPFYEEISTPVSYRHYKHVTQDPGTYLTPGHAPPRTPSNVKGDEEHIYDNF